MGAQAYEARAAMAGQGVAILTRALFSAELADGRLIQPFDIVGNDGNAYWLVYPEARRNVPKIRAFRDWLLAEIAASDRRLGALRGVRSICMRGGWSKQWRFDRVACCNAASNPA